MNCPSVTTADRYTSIPMPPLHTDRKVGRGDATIAQRIMQTYISWRLLSIVQVVIEFHVLQSRATLSIHVVVLQVLSTRIESTEEAIVRGFKRGHGNSVAPRCLSYHAPIERSVVSHPLDLRFLLLGATMEHLEKLEFVLRIDAFTA